MQAQISSARTSSPAISRLWGMISIPNLNPQVNNRANAFAILPAATIASVAPTTSASLSGT